MENTKCPICGKSVETPYRRVVSGVIIEGCISKFHNAAFECVVSNSSDWHNRKEAKKLRKEHKI